MKRNGTAKRLTSLLLCAAMLLLALPAVFVAVAEEEPEGATLLGTSVMKFGDDLPEGTVTGDIDTGYTFQTTGWKAIVSYYNGGMVDLKGETYLRYDFTVAEGAEFLIRMDGWNASASAVIGAKHGVKMGGDDGDMLPSGTYTGTVSIEDTLTELSEDPFAILGVVKGPVTVRKLEVYSIKGENDVPKIPTEAEYDKSNSLLGSDVTKFGDELTEGTVTGTLTDGYTLQTEGWKAIVSYYDSADIDLSGNTYLYYDFTVSEGAEFLIRMNGWDASASALIGTQYDVAMGGDDGDMLPPGTYTGYVDINEVLTELPEETYAILGVVNGPVTVRALDIRNVTSIDGDEQGVRGDVNGDGKVTVADYGLALAHVRGTKLLTGSALAAADINGDGKVTVADYGLILAHVRGTKLLF